MDLLTIGLVALGLVVLFVVATHKSKKTSVQGDLADISIAQGNAPTVTEIAAKAEVVNTKPAKKAPAKKAAPAKKPAAKKPAAIKAPAKKAPAKKPAKAKKA